MKNKIYRINEIFYSVQAEGGNAGRPAIFVRFAGCNLSCPFCDTNHEPYKEMTQEQIEAEVARLDPHNVNNEPAAMIVFTGGEPTLQLTDDCEFCAGRFRAMETNGILPAPSWIDWVTVSPKTMLSQEQLNRADELKVLFNFFSDRYLCNLGEFARAQGKKCFLQPIADKEGNFDVEAVYQFCLQHPVWSISLQWHKLFNIH